MNSFFAEEQDQLLQLIIAIQEIVKDLYNIPSHQDNFKNGLIIGVSPLYFIYDPNFDETKEFTETAKFIQEIIGLIKNKELSLIDLQKKLIEKI